MPHVWGPPRPPSCGCISSPDFHSPSTWFLLWGWGQLSASRALEAFLRKVTWYRVLHCQGRQAFRGPPEPFVKLFWCHTSSTARDVGHPTSRWEEPGPIKQGLQADFRHSSHSGHQLALSNYSEESQDRGGHAQDRAGKLLLAWGN